LLKGKENAMGFKEIDHTIRPYTVGHEDCKVLPRSFKTLAEAEAYLAEQDKGALERGEFYLDGPEQDNAASNRIAGGVCVNPIVAVPTAADPAEVDSECTSIESQTTRGAWTREIEELCHALEAQQRAPRPRTDAKKKVTWPSTRYGRAPRESHSASPPSYS
jgi:hypothetical protein